MVVWTKFKFFFLGTPRFTLITPRTLKEKLNIENKENHSVFYDPIKSRRTGEWGIIISRKGTGKIRI